MKNEELSKGVLVYLKKQKEANTFKIARELRIDRYKLLDALADLAECGAVAVKHGTVKFLHFARIGKKLKRAGPKKQTSPPLPKKKAKPKKSHSKKRA